VTNKTKRIAIVVSDVDFSNHYLWIAKGLSEQGKEVHFIWLNLSMPSIHDKIKELNVKSYYLKYHNTLELPLLMIKLFLLFLKIKPEIIHAHLYNAGRAALPIAKLMGINRIYTRHYSTLNHDFHPNAVLQDKIMNALSDKVVAVSEGVKSALIQKENLKSEKIVVIPHGFDFSHIHAPNYLDKKSARERLSITENQGPVIGVVSRFVEWKGIQYIIPAFKNFLNRHPNALLVLANAKGEYEPTIRELCDGIPSDNLKIIEFESNQNNLYHSFDCFIHVPINHEIEAYGQVYIEASAYGLPCIFTRSGIANDFTIDNTNCLIVPFKDSISISDALNRIFTDDSLAQRIGQNARTIVLEKYQVHQMIEKHLQVYNGQNSL
jgi:glycosyltransferase involved in cell wall biosynthesis